MIERFNEFIKEMEKETYGLEAALLADTKQVLAEHHFTGGAVRNIYSHTKSFMVTAAGIAIGEGKLSLDDTLAGFFPEALPNDPHPDLLKIRLKDLLTMSSGFGKPYLMSADRRIGTGLPNYLEYMLSRPMEYLPGSKFTYSTADSHLAGIMVSHAVGQKLDMYLYEKLFRPMGIGYPIWEKDPQGNPNGGGGLFLTLEDMAKLGMLYLNHGVWNGERLVPEEWTTIATTKKIDTDGNGNWNCGYCYQFWMMPDGISYRADGAYGQITIVMPEKGYVLSFQTSEQGQFSKVQPIIDELLLK